MEVVVVTEMTVHLVLVICHNTNGNAGGLGRAPVPAAAGGPSPPDPPDDDDDGDEDDEEGRNRRSSRRRRPRISRKEAEKVNVPWLACASW